MKNLLIILFSLTILISCKDDDNPTFQEQLDIDLEIIDNYLTDNGITAIKDPTGVYYIIEEEGTGTEHPTTSSFVTMAYTGKYMDGSVFESTSSTTPFKQYLTNVIPGWQVGVPKFKKGGKGTLIIPSGFAYGVFGQGPIPSNTNLIFEIELLDFTN